MRRASQPPPQTRRLVIERNVPRNGRFGQRGQHCDAEAVARRFIDRRAAVLLPRYVKDIVIAGPCDLDAPVLVRQRSMLHRIRCELVQRHADDLRGFPGEAKVRPVDRNAGSNRFGKIGELRMNQGRKIDAFPFVLHQQVEIDRERLDALGELAQEVTRARRGRLARDRQDDAEHVLGPMIDFEHEQAHLLLGPLAIRDVDARRHDRSE